MPTTSSVLTQHDIESEIYRILTALEDELIPELAGVSTAAAKAEAAYKVHYAQEYLKAGGPTATRNAQATVHTSSELFQRLASDRAVTTAREKLRAYETSLDSLRTLLVGVRNQTQ